MNIQYKSHIILNKIMKFFIVMFALLASLSAQADVEINENTFPDENFRNWILAKDYGKDGVLTDEEISAVTKITLTTNINTNKIQSLKGIEYFTELTQLLVEIPLITEIDVSKLTKLTYLDCSMTQISELDVSKNTALTELDCSGNQLTSLDVSNNTTLTRLSCNSNQLTSLDVSNNTELEILYCKDNQLTELDVSKNKELKRFVCSKNLLTSLNVSGHAKLESMRCERNKLTMLDVSDCPKLWEIYCFNNQIKGEAMDAFIEGLPISPRNRGFLMVADTVNEQNVMTKAQVAATKAKGWSPCYVYGAFGEWGYPEYEGSDDASGISSALKGQMANDKWYDLQGRRISAKPARSIYIEEGKKIVTK